MQYRRSAGPHRQCSMIPPCTMFRCWWPILLGSMLRVPQCTPRLLRCHPSSSRLLGTVIQHQRTIQRGSSIPPRRWRKWPVPRCLPRRTIQLGMCCLPAWWIQRDNRSQLQRHKRPLRWSHRDNTIRLGTESPLQPTIQRGNRSLQTQCMPPAEQRHPGSRSRPCTTHPHRWRSHWDSMSQGTQCMGLERRIHQSSRSQRDTESPRQRKSQMGSTSQPGWRSKTQDWRSAPHNRSQLGKGHQQARWSLMGSTSLHSQCTRVAA
jgi:hypothetical protein